MWGFDHTVRKCQNREKWRLYAMVIPLKEVPREEGGTVDAYRLINK